MDDFTVLRVVNGHRGSINSAEEKGGDSNSHKA